MKTKILLMAVAFLVSVAGGSLYAIAAGNVEGWLWGGSENPSDGIINANETGMGPINPMTGKAYGVRIPNGDGPVTGFAWSYNYGWIDFAPQDNCGVLYQAVTCIPPAGGIAGVVRSNNKLENYARVVSIAQDTVDANNGGWQGWILMNPAAAGVTIDPDTGDLSGYAWSGEHEITTDLTEGIGWIDFKLANITPVKELIVCQDKCDSGVRTSSLSLFQNDSRDVAACYTDTVCDDAASNVTDVSTWTEDLSGTNVVSLSGSDPEFRTILADQGSEGTEGLRVEYADMENGRQLVDIDVVVIGSGSLCGNGIIDAGEDCDLGSGNNGSCPATCSTSCSSNSCDGNKFKEVAP